MVTFKTKKLNSNLKDINYFKVEQNIIETSYKQISKYEYENLDVPVIKY